MLNPEKQKHVLARILLAMALLCAAVSHGQDENNELPADSAAGPARADADTSSGSDSGTESVTGRERTSPFEYEASEQISEDLSVSFPVDI
ncbi:hypothetical protein CWI75_13995 [Kineobactrum sediminis]|uniref:Uncharacterized protein n=1 Tax=Kineobactrum sediminis TaxID=1905677 RepID=A0A2N5Y0C8_9GAMM|nr:hypothetical protein [Kineobactrum sediminis]PLW81852.1 hypothetical protein CWI75_13995 [Kineobactrum sediminis]